MIAAALLLAAATSGVADLPDFEFKDAVAGQQIAPKEFGRCRASVTPQMTICHRGFDTITDVAEVPVRGLALMLYNGRLSSVTGDFNSAFFDKLSAAFTVKYGAPCKTEAPMIQNRMGASFENPTSHWCFKTGELLLIKNLGRIGEATFRYQDVWTPAAPTPKVDF